jgi:PPM family protein phosphatase
MPQFEAAIAASQGARRYQEDAAAVWPAPSSEATMLAVLADGMGGHAGGAAASRLVCDTFIDSCVAGDGKTSARLLGALNAANGAVSRAASETPALHGMGSTLIGAAFGPDGLEWVSVGDSPLYLYRHAEIALLNEDHSLAPALDRLAAQGQITAEAARNDPRRHMLRSAVTGEELDLVDLSRKPLVLEPGDYVILASDGIHALSEAEISRVIKGYAGDGPKAVADALIRVVLEMKEPHQDNVTVVAVRLSPAALVDDGA